MRRQNIKSSSKARLNLEAALAQAREKIELLERQAKIETALERVRARTMAMHKSEELSEAASVLFQQLAALSIEPAVCGFTILNRENNIGELYFSIKGKVFPKKILFPHDLTRTMKKVYEEWKGGSEFLTTVLEGREQELENEKLDAYWQSHGVELFSDLTKFFDEHGIAEMRKKQVVHYAFFSHGFLHFSHYKEFGEVELLKRFAKVFDQTYTRFLDLQKAEEQAHEAQIEAALERVRAKAMAMRSSEDLSDTMGVFFEELKNLGVTPVRCGVAEIKEETRSWTLAMTNATQQGDSHEILGEVRRLDHPVLQGIYSHWEKQEEYFPVLQGEDIKQYYQVLRPQVSIPEFPDDAVHYGNYFYFKEGMVFAWTHEKMPDSVLQIFRRFTSVLSLTYRRYLDLQEAEQQAREAVRQASLDRVRAEIASMRTTDDLRRITPLIWRELTALGVPFFRCGVFIIDETVEQVHIYLSTPKGEALAVLDLPFSGPELIQQTVQHWRTATVFRDEWDRQQFQDWMQSLVEQDLIKDRQEYQGGEAPPEKLVLQLVPFEQGMLYVGSDAPLAAGEIDLMKMLAGAFAVAFARYEDFQRLEAAKAKVEAAFGELGVLSKELEAKNKELEAENLRKARELEEAQRLQLAMLPEKPPELPHLDIAVYMQPATEVGGDYYDFKLEDDGTLTAAIGDATGHGLQAGTMVATAKGLFNSLAHEPDPVHILQKSSSAIKAMGFPRLYMALLLAKFKDRQVRIASAGMPYALIYRARSGQIEEIVLKGMPLGSFPEFPYQQKNVSLSTGDTILFISDGLEEMFNDKDETLGTDQVKTLFAEAGRTSPAQIIAHLQQAGAAWAGARPQVDDVTMVVVRMK